MSVPITAQSRVPSSQLHLRICPHTGHLFLLSSLQTCCLRVEVTLCSKLGHMNKSANDSYCITTGQAVERRRDRAGGSYTATQLMQAVNGQGQRNGSYLREDWDEKWHGSKK